MQTPASQMELLIGLFGKLSDKQIEQMAKLLVSNSLPHFAFIHTQP
jgi:hypothetical protein